MAGESQRFKYAELAKATRDFAVENLIADDGAFGPVFHGVLGSVQHVAIKQMREQCTLSDGITHHIYIYMYIYIYIIPVYIYI